MKSWILAILLVGLDILSVILSVSTGDGAYLFCMSVACVLFIVVNGEEVDDIVKIASVICVLLNVFGFIMMNTLN